MTIFKSLPDNANLRDVGTRFPKMHLPLMELHEVILRGESGLSIGERELIAAYTSLQNACKFCHGAHKEFAKIFGIDEALFESITSDLNSAKIPEKLKPILAYAKKPTLTPSKIVQADADLVYAAGWSEEGLFDVISTCALFNFMNRIVDGSSIKVKADISRLLKQEGKQHSYLAFKSEHIDK